MKKILSLFMALTLVMSLSAGPVSLAFSKKASQSTPRLEQVQKQTTAVKHAPKNFRQVERTAAIRRAPMGNTVVKLDPATQTPISTDDTQNGEAISLTINGVGIAYNGTLNAATDYTPADFRVFGGKTLTLSASSNIVSVKIAGKANKAGFTLTVDEGTITTGASYGDITEKATLEDPLIVVDNINKTSVALTVSKQARIYMIEVTLGEGDTPTPPTPSGDVEIKGMQYADAYYSEGYWDFDIYKDYNYDTYSYTYPDVYFSCVEEASSKTTIAGTYTAYYAGYWSSENDSIEADEYNPVGTLTVTFVSKGVYNFVGSFVGTDGKTYTWNAQNIEVWAYDVDNDYDEITLTDGGVTPTPGDTIALDVDGIECAYYPSYSEEGAYNYTLVIYNSKSEDYVPQVGFDIYTEKKDVFTGKFSVEGENLGLEYSAFYPDVDSEGEALSDATVTVTEGEGDNLIVNAVFTTEEGQVYTLSVEGKPSIYDADHPYEPEEAKTFNLTAVSGEMDDTYFADYGLVYYYLEMEDGSIVGLTYRTANGTQPVGTFAISDKEGVDAFLTGMDYYGYADGSYYETIDGDVYYFVSGSVTLATDEEGNTTITINATSVYGSTFTVKGTIGAPQPTPGHTIVIADYADVNFTTMDGIYAVASAANGGATPAYNKNSFDLRLYAKNSMTLTSNKGNMIKMIFNISSKGLDRQAEIAVSTGSMSYDMKNAQVTWVGNASEVVFTVGDLAVYGTESSKAGQFDFTSIDIEQETSALYNVNADVKAVKTMVNGQLFIEANGVRYNVLGTVF